MAGPLDHRSDAQGGSRPALRLHLVDASAGLPQRRPIRVLYVEDDDEDVFLLGRHLERLPNFQASYVFTRSLEEARGLLAGESFDVVLCDFWLGCETTIPLIDELSLSPRPAPVVLVSSLENEDIELIGRRAGAAGFVAKADLSAAALDRIFATLLPAEIVSNPAPTSGVGNWLRALMRSIDRARSVAVDSPPSPFGDSPAAILAELLGPAEAHDDILQKLAGLERATRAHAGVTRFDAVPYLADAVRALRSRVENEARVTFMAPVAPILIDSTPALFGDLIQGFFAEAVDALGSGCRLEVLPSIADGALEVSLLAEAGDAEAVVDGSEADEGARIYAAADARRFLARTLAAASGGTLDFGPAADQPMRIARLSVPLRTPL